MTQVAILVAVSTAAVPLHVEPFHQHDCDCCKFLGWADGPAEGGLLSAEAHENQHVDVWLHRDEDHDTLILRTGDEGPDYACFPLEIARRVCAPSYAAGVALVDAWLAAGTPAEWAGLALRTG